MFKNYLHGGICAILSALISLPATAVYAISMLSLNETYALLKQFLLLGHTVLLSFLFLYVLEFSREKLNITNIRWLIYSLIGTAILINAPALFISHEHPELFAYYYFASTGLSVVNGILALILGLKLMKSGKENIKHASSAGMWFAITGVLMATIILSPLALLTGVILDIYLAMMFLSNRKKPLTNGPEGSPEVA